MPRAREDVGDPTNGNNCRPYRPSERPVVQYTDMPREVVAVVDRVMSGSMSVEELIAWCAGVDQRWPGVGWGEAKWKLKTRTKACNKNLTAGQRRAKTLSEWESQPWQSEQRSREELEQQKAVIVGIDGKPVPEEVPF